MLRRLIYFGIEGESDVRASRATVAQRRGAPGVLLRRQAARHVAQAKYHGT